MTDDFSCWKKEEEEVGGGNLFRVGTVDAVFFSSSESTSCYSLLGCLLDHNESKGVQQWYFIQVVQSSNM